MEFSGHADHGRSGDSLPHRLEVSQPEFLKSHQPSPVAETSTNPMAIAYSKGEGIDNRTNEDARPLVHLPSTQHLSRCNCFATFRL